LLKYETSHIKTVSISIYRDMYALIYRTLSPPCVLEHFSSCQSYYYPILATLWFDHKVWRIYLPPFLSIVSEIIYNTKHAWCNSVVWDRYVFYIISGPRLKYICIW